MRRRHRKVDIDLAKLPVDLMSWLRTRPTGQGHRRLVRAPQAARAHRGADAWRRSRTRMRSGTLPTHQIVAWRGVCDREGEMHTDNERITCCISA